MPTIQELRTKADELKKKEDFENALPLFREIWDKFRPKTDKQSDEKRSPNQ